MAKKQNVEESVSLFPFLSILACIIGILVLMIASITLSQIGRDEPAATDNSAAAKKAAEEAKQRVEQYKAARATIQQDRKQLNELQQAADRSKAVRSVLEEVRVEYEALQTQHKPSEDERRRAEEELLKHQAELERLAEEMARLERQLKPLQDQQEKLKVELDKRKAPPEEAPVRILPSGSGVDLNATFVECAAASVVLHDGPEPVRIPTGQLAGNAEYRRLLDKVKQTEKGTVIFLVRPDGVASYNAARNLARGSYVTNGKLAIAGQGKLDLSVFQKR
jgi:5-bromo-4-chloroindolyl phosphate hydrolysis protein